MLCFNRMSTATLTFEEQLKRVDMAYISEEGRKIYERVKDQYLPVHKGKFLAINADTADAYLGDTTIQALEQARSKHPDTVFYVVKIGYSAMEIMSGVAV